MKCSASSFEGRATAITDSKIRAGFLDLARMCRDLAAQMERQLEVMKQRAGNRRSLADVRFTPNSDRSAGIPDRQLR
jgi:hypothetical protein